MRSRRDAIENCTGLGTVTTLGARVTAEGFPGVPPSAASATRTDATAYRCLVSAINDLALAPSEWPTVLRLLGRAFNCHYAAAITTTPERDAPGSLGAIGITADDHREFLRSWHKHNVYGSRWPAREAGAVVLGSSIVPRAELVRSVMYRHYLAPRKIEEVVRLDVLHESDRSQSISLARTWSSGAFADVELQFAQALMPYLQRAVVVQTRLGDASAAARSALDALETAQAPIFILDRRGRVVHASAEAARLLREADGLSIATGDALRAAAPSLSARLATLITRTVGTHGEPGTSGTLRLPRPSGKPALTLVSVPLPLYTAGPGAHHPAVLLQVADPGARANPHRALLVEAFELTPAEADLAADLLAGLSVREIAAGSGRSIATVRTHLASLLAKTSTARQSELIRLLMRLPRAPNG
jgi:DNA-binding CsgD family transcriptional regulator